MTNRWRQGLYNQIYDKKSKIEEKEELDYSDQRKVERIDTLEEELNNTPIMTDAEFEEFERKIESIGDN